MRKDTLMVLSRDRVLTTLYGHSIRFKKDTPVHVPGHCVNAALEIGAVPADGADPAEAEDSSTATAPIDPAEREEAILAAFELLVETNNRDDFTAAGAPTAAAVKESLGYSVQAKEIAALWQKRSELIADAD